MNHWGKSAAQALVSFNLMDEVYCGNHYAMIIHSLFDSYCVLFKMSHHR